MGELEDRIGSVLSDPEQLAQIRALAQSIMGGASSGASPGGEAAAPKENAAPPGTSFQSDSAASLEKLGALLRGGLGAGNPRLAALEALAPCLGEKRREKLARAMKLARVLRLAQAGLLSTEGKDV